MTIEIKQNTSGIPYQKKEYLKIEGERSMRRNLFKIGILSYIINLKPKLLREVSRCNVQEKSYNFTATVNCKTATVIRIEISKEMGNFFDSKCLFCSCIFSPKDS